MNWIKYSRKFCLIFCGVAVVIARTSADTVTLRLAADAEIQQADPDTNYGRDTTMVSGALGFTANRVIRRALLRFELAGQIPVGATINSATVRVRVTKVPSGPANSTFDLRRVLKPWTEAGVTWNSRSASGDTWQISGAIDPADTFPTASSSVPVAGVATYTFPSTASLIADVLAWVNNPASNNGWLLISENELTAKTARHFGTHENINPANVPALVIDFTLPSPEIQFQPQGGTVSVGDPVTFSVGVAGAPPLSYQWLFGTNDIAGATNSILFLSNVQTNDSGDYRVIVRNPGGSTGSQPASLTVLPVAAFLPKVTVTSPVDGAKFAGHASVLMSAEAAASNATISQVEFFVNGSSVGSDTNSSASFLLNDLLAGNYSLTAKATDSRGRLGASVPVGIRVLAPPRPVLISPLEGTRFPLGSNVSLAVEFKAPSLEGDVERVEFFEGSSRIARLDGPHFAFEWTPTVPRDYVLTATAVDSLGQTGVTSSVGIRIYVPESIRPTIVITNSPANFARLTSPLVSLAGTADDNIGLDHVEASVNGDTFQRASGTNRWFSKVSLRAGNNTVRLRSVDLAGNVSLDATRFFTFVVNTALTVRTNGQGTVTPDLNGRLLEIGKLYSLKAVPRTGQIFSRWDGAPWQGALLNFQMQSNLVLTASFIPNPFPAVAGSYAGLGLNPAGVSPESSGFFTLQVTTLGAFSGKLTQAGGTLALRGQFNAEGEVRTALLRPGRVPLAVALRLDLTNGTDQVRGTITDGVWVSELLGNRNVFNSRTNPAGQAGTRVFTWRWAGVSNSVAASATAKIAPGGSVTFTVRMVDGRMFAPVATMSRNGDVPFYVLFGTTEVVAGWLNFGLPPLPRVSGIGSWVRSGTNGFATLLEVSP